MRYTSALLFLPCCFSVDPSTPETFLDSLQKSDPKGLAILAVIILVLLYSFLKSSRSSQVTVVFKRLDPAALQRLTDSVASQIAGLKTDLRGRGGSESSESLLRVTQAVDTLKQLQYQFQADIMKAHDQIWTELSQFTLSQGAAEMSPADIGKVSLREPVRVSGPEPVRVTLSDPVKASLREPPKVNLPELVKLTIPEPVKVTTDPAKTSLPDPPKVSQEPVPVKESTESSESPIPNETSEVAQSVIIPPTQTEILPDVPLEYSSSDIPKEGESGNEDRKSEPTSQGSKSSSRKTSEMTEESKKPPVLVEENKTQDTDKRPPSFPKIVPPVRKPGIARPKYVPPPTQSNPFGSK